MTRTGSVKTSVVSGSPRVFGSRGEFAADVAGVVRSARPLAAVFLHGRLDRRERERIMPAVSRVNACRGLPDDVAASAAHHLSPAERSAVEAVAGLMALANLSANTAGTIYASLAAARTRRSRRAPHT